MADNSFYARYSNTFYDNLAEKAKKQKYLIDNILHQGYDKEVFAQYMISQRGRNFTGPYLPNYLYIYKFRRLNAISRYLGLLKLK